MNPTIAAGLIYIMVMLCLQFTGFLVSQSVHFFLPSISLMTFLLFFVGAMFGAWPVALRITERFVPGAKPVHV
jgi:hypothetical protein